MKRFFIFLLLVTLCASPTQTAYASTLTNIVISQATQRDDTLYIFYDVLDENNNPIADTGIETSVTLGQQHFTPQAELFSELGENVGYVFAVDISKSLSENQFAQVRGALNTWLLNMRDGDYAALMTFGNQVTLVSDFTNDKFALKSMIDNLARTDTKTTLYEGVIRAVDVAKRQGDLPLRRAVIVLSDGIDDFPAGATLGELSEKAELPLYIVGVDSGNKSAAGLKELGGVARLSGGDLYMSSQIAAGYEEILRRINGSFVAKIPLDDSLLGNKQGLILSVSNSGITAEADMDVRLRAFAEAQPTPSEPEATPEAPEPTPVSATPDASEAVTPRAATPPPVAVPLPGTQNGFFAWLGAHWWIPAIVAVAAGIAALVYILLQNKTRTRQDSEMKAFDKNRELDDMLIQQPAQNGDETVLLNGDETVPLMAESAMIVKLIQRGDGADKEYTLQKSVVVGRKSSESDIVIADKTVSGRHCEFRVAPDGVYVRDMQSANKTFLVQGRKTHEVGGEGEKLDDGDIVRIGKTELVVRIIKR